MFEKLAGNILSKVLSNYFTDESLSKNKVFKNAQLGVWSGYITLHDLEVKADVINQKLRQKGQPFELVQCSLRRVEITIPWARLSIPISSGGSNGHGSNEKGPSQHIHDAVAVLVMDGVHVLFRTTYQFHDDKLREEEIKERRKALSVSESFARSTSSCVDDYYKNLEQTVGVSNKSYMDLFKQRITSGFMQEIAQKLHVHIRDVHIRIEDTESDPEAPFAYGVTMESMHLQHDDEEEEDGQTKQQAVPDVVSRVTQMNHFAVYWNALDYGEGLHSENSVLHETCAGNKERLSQALNKCIARRGSMLHSPSKTVYIPKHTYILLPVDGYLHALLSTTPKILSTRPAIDIVVQLDSVSTNLRDFQCVQFLKFSGERKNFMFVKKYRRFRPDVSVIQDPKKWWEFAVRVIRWEMKGNTLRWSSTRFQTSYQLRGRYMELFERTIQQNGNLDSEAGEVRIGGESLGRRLSESEQKEIQDLEDGLIGDLSVADIILYRALTRVRLRKAVLTDNLSSNGIDTSRTLSWWKQAVTEATAGDVEARNELDRLLQYLDQIPCDKLVPESKSDSLTAISLVVQLEEVNFAILSPLHITSNETQLKRLHEKFIDLQTKVVRIGGTLKGDYKRFDLEFSVVDFAASEIRQDKSRHILATQLRRNDVESEVPGCIVSNDRSPPLFLFSFAKQPTSNPEVDMEIKMYLSPVEICLIPECQWLAHLKEFMKEITTVPNVQKFWRELSLAHLNSMTLGRLELHAKAESAASNHENIDLDLNLHCPVIRVGMGEHGDLIIDPGYLIVKTEKLAGVSRNSSKKVPLFEKKECGNAETRGERWQNSSDVVSLGGAMSVRSRSTRRNSMRRFFLSTSMSIDSNLLLDRSNQSFSGSFNLEDNRVPLESNDRGSNSDANLEFEDLFFDRYRLRLLVGGVTLSGESEIFDVSSNFEISTVIQKSVIPTDHTLCKLKTHTIIDDIKILLDENKVMRLGRGMNIWKLLITDVSFLASDSCLNQSSPNLANIGELISHHSIPTDEDDISDVDSADEIIEDEFFDAQEGSDSVGGGHSGVWFEDYWIADAESVIDGESRASFNGRRSRRRPPSVSDMSSVSDQSAKRTRRSNMENGYLSAENLARLEEAVDDEDDSIPDIRKDQDDDSFQSVMSVGGQEKLLRELDETIQKTEDRIQSLIRSSRSDGYSFGAENFTPSDHRKRRMQIRAQLDRAKAELKVVQALSSDLRSFVTEEPDDAYSSVISEARQQAHNARALVRAKRDRDAAESGNGHNMVRNLNRELFKGSFLVNKINITLRFGLDSGNNKNVDPYNEAEANTAEVEIKVNQVGLALFRHANGTKAYFSLEQVSVRIDHRTRPSNSWSNIIFSGGTNDTVLPTHLPHLIAHSMEDRFLRGAINLRRRRVHKELGRVANVLKLRLVLGDVEFWPCERRLWLLLACIDNLKKELVPQNRPNDNTHSRETSSRHATEYVSDLAFRLASVRILLSNNEAIVAAAASTEASARYLFVSSSKQERLQLDFRCTNVQLLGILSMEGGRGLELFGRRDPFNAILQGRLRRQLVAAEERGGWVVGGEPGCLLEICAPSINLVRNLHLGLRINPCTMVASRDAYLKIADSVRAIQHRLKQVSFFSKENKQERENPKGKLEVRYLVSFPLRWRIDVSFRRINISCPRDIADDWGITDDLGAKMLIALTIVLSVQESPVSNGSFSIRTGLSDISLIRTSDDWPILEPFSIIKELVLRHQVVSRLTMEKAIAPLLLQPGSPIGEIEAMMARHGWDSTHSRKTGDIPLQIIVKITPIKVNFSAPVIGLLAGIARSTNRRESSVVGKNGHSSLQNWNKFLPTPSTVQKNGRFGIQISVDDVELQLLRETEAKPMALASPQVCFTMTDVSIDYSQGDQVTASILIRDSALFDLTSGKGIRVVGEDPEARLDFPYFVRMKLYMHYSPQTIRLHINWGRIQCLILPSFARSLLEFKNDLESPKVRGHGNPKGLEREGKMDLFACLIRHPYDFNLILSADAEMFECILSSRDVIEYAKKGSKDSIGVVTFRWKASLSIAIALDSLRESSMPWLTLNLDGIFTDDDDIDLFQDFTSRYLVHNSGISGEELEQDHELVNAFTIRISHRVSSFQALRTNIVGTDLPTSPHRSFTSLPRICFKLSQPFVGEQRITNPIEFMLLYRATGTSMQPSKELYPRDDKVEMAQLVQVKANFIDVLLYIQSKSPGGLTDSYRTSLRPILDMIRKKEARKVADESATPDMLVDSSSRKDPPNFFDLVKRSITICTICIQGFQVTCVPGGASRLNESPIIKLELEDVSCGLAAALVPPQLNLLKDGVTHKRMGSPTRKLIAGSEVTHMTLVGWVGCQLTGHYHNRRLVAWEPFIEPWKTKVRFGLDLVEAFHWIPAVKPEPKMLQTFVESAPSGLDTRIAGPAVTGKDRLREFGRLFRSPFQQNPQSIDSPRKGPRFISHSDFCYLMLSSSARKTIAAAMYPTGETSSAFEPLLFVTIPSHSPQYWLQCFGQPSMTTDRHESSEPFSFSVVLSDLKPLNINVTGSLIENVIGYRDHAQKTGSKASVPHLIRNDTGMTIRFREVLDIDRVKHGETPARVILANGSQAPLTLKRSLSQTCDPHRGYIYLEIGNFEDTVGRIHHEDLDIPKGQMSSSFFFKTAAKIPVDAVGVHRYPLDSNVELRPDVKSVGSSSRALGWIIVRVALRGSVKVVSVESPFVLKSAADADLLCEVRDQTGLSLLWRCLIPKDEGKGKLDGIVSIPADIVPFVHDGSYRFSAIALSRTSSFSHEVEVDGTRGAMVEIVTPPPFSSESFGKGLIGEEDAVLPVIVSSHVENEVTKLVVDCNEKIHLTVCSVRIGTVNLSPVDTIIEVPEQRMIFFRSSLAIRNFLALPIAVQVRARAVTNMNPIGLRNEKEPVMLRRSPTLSEWENLGVLDCGDSVNWTGSLSTATVQIRTRFVGTDGDNSRRFPSWSSIVEIPSRRLGFRGKRLEKNTVYAKMKLSDAENASLSLSVAMELGTACTFTDQSEGEESIRHLCQTFSPAARVVSIFVPYWIVDETNQDLEFYAGSPVAGQLEGSQPKDEVKNEWRVFGHTLGLAELLDNEHFLDSSSKIEFNVLMVGEDNSNRLTVRKRVARKSRLAKKTLYTPWSDPIPILAGKKTQHHFTVLSPNELNENQSADNDVSQSFDRLILKSRTIDAARRFGGEFGTKIIHIVNKYSVSNETGRDIELSNGGLASSVTIRATASPQAFHFDDSRPVRFRYKEFGWTWSGYFNVRSSMREVTMRVRHKMRSQTVIVTVELRNTKQSATSLLVFRQSNYPPFRLENHTMHPLGFGQSLSVLGQEEIQCDSLLLQYQSADFAWDEPELRRRILIVKSSGSGKTGEDLILGRFSLDRIGPGTVIKLDNNLFTAEIVADGPTRVLRISDASMPRTSSFRQDELDYFHHDSEADTFLTISLIAKFNHGVGISVVDFFPKELLYIRLDDIQIEKRLDTKKDDINIAVGSIKLNNQLWVTPYPVLLKMGRQYDPGASTARRRNRRHDAISIGWRSSVKTHGGYGNVTLLDKVEVNTEPVFVNVDGELADALYRMSRHVVSMRTDGKDNQEGQSRDEGLKTLLGIRTSINAGNQPTISVKVGSLNQHDAGIEVVSSAAVAAKLRSRPESQLTPTTPGRVHRRSGERKEKKQRSSKAEHKFYIERLRISSTRVDLSWSGPLPGLLSSLLFKALTFERLPVRLRPFSSSHAYGNLQDHLQTLRSHYLSFWRVADFLVGLSSNPTFLFRAVIYTFRESCASLLDSFAGAMKNSSHDLTRMILRDSEIQPIYFGEEPFQETNKSPVVLQKLFVPFASVSALFLNNTSSVISWLSSHLKYGNKGNAQKSPELMRSRSPRLFAHVDGKDLLVEYVEGENAGKALLSRVRMGLHLGEGYVFHAEDARQRRPNGERRTDLDPLPLILMMTSERLLLLTGKLDRDFCSVVWESYFMNIAHVTIKAVDELSSFTFDEIVIWHLSDPEFSAGNRIEETHVFAQNLVRGIDVLRSRSIFVPRPIGKQVLQKMNTVDNRLG